VSAERPRRPGDDDQTAPQKTRHDTAHDDTVRNDGGNDEVLRFGPGVPSAPPPDGLAELWRAGREAPRRRRRRLLRGLISASVTAALAVAVLLWLLLRGQGDGLQVTAIRVQTPQQPQGCDATVDVTGILTTNGEAGRITYRWTRSDGHDSGLLHETVAAGKRDVTIHLSWVVRGPGQRRFTATLDLVEPKGTAAKASSAFGYSCR
jgi:hypothetical protein